MPHSDASAQSQFWAALAFESPKLSMVAQVNEGSFGYLLDRAIERSNKATRQIKAKPTNGTEPKPMLSHRFHEWRIDVSEGFSYSHPGLDAGGPGWRHFKPPVPRCASTSVQLIPNNFSTDVRQNTFNEKCLYYLSGNPTGGRASVRPGSPWPVASENSIH